MKRHEQLERILKTMDVADANLSADDANTARRLEAVLATDPTVDVQTSWQLPTRPRSAAPLWAAGLAMAVLIVGIFLGGQLQGLRDDWPADWGRDPVGRAVNGCREDTHSENQPADAAERLAAARPVLVQPHGLEASVILADDLGLFRLCSVSASGGAASSTRWDMLDHHPGPAQVIALSGHGGGNEPDATSELAGIVGRDVVGLAIPRLDDAVITIKDGYFHIWRQGPASDAYDLARADIPAIVTLADGTSHQTVLKYGF